MGMPPRLGVVICGLLLPLLLLMSSTAYRPPPAADYRPPPSVTDHRPPPSVTAHRPPSAVGFRPPPSVTDHRPPPSVTAHRPPSAVDHRPPPTAELTSGTNSTSCQSESLVRDCSDLSYGSPSGVYVIKPDLTTSHPVYCDMSDGEGWTVFQRRADITPRRDFLLDWESYKWGFGALDQEFWWGLHFLWQLTSELDRTYELRVDLWDWENQTRYATYQDFTIASEADGYRLDFTDYSYFGTAGDGLTRQKGMKFTTIDRDNDNWPSNCAADFIGAWWYNECYDSNLNGLYKPENTSGGTLYWLEWRGHYSLNATTMKIRPTKKL